jgi:hypothetical protein
MTVGVTLNFPAATSAQYNRTCELMGLTPRGAGPAGLLFHWATQIEGGARTTDVWQDKATFDAFVESHILPYTAKVGVEPATSVTVYDVYNYFTAGA